MVDDAKNTGSPLHQFFEWDDSKAAHEHRMQQAGKLIRGVVVKKIDSTPIKKNVRAFLNVSGDGDQRYVDVVSVMSNEQKRMLVLKRAHSEVKAWRERYQDMSEFAVVFAAVVQLTEAAE